MHQATDDVREESTRSRADGRAPAVPGRQPRRRLGGHEEGVQSRLDTLDGKTVGLVWNRVFRGDETLPMIGELLQERFPDVKLVPWTQFPVTSVPSLHSGAPATNARVPTGRAHRARLRGGDRRQRRLRHGAAAASRLAITAERTGIPAVAVGSTHFFHCSASSARWKVCRASRSPSTREHSASSRPTRCGRTSHDRPSTRSSRH